MTDERVLVIVPSRGRPERLAYMLEESLRLSGGLADFAVCTDDDDPSAPEYDALRDSVREAWPGRTLWFRGPRRTMTDWTNHVAAHPRAVRYGFLGSFGDDHVPRTPGWAGKLTAAIEARGGTGIAYGDDRHQHENLPTAPVVSAAIVRVLGWLILPGTRSKFADNAWRDLADLAGCLIYVPDVVIEHVHPDAGKAVRDETYTEGNLWWAADEAAYLSWVRDADADGRTMRDRDVAAVRGAMELRAAKNRLRALSDSELSALRIENQPGAERSPA